MFVGNSQLLRVLVVEDDEDDFRIIQDLLSEITVVKFQITWCSKFETGLDTILNQQQDVCLIDYRLGAKTGLELIREAVTKGVKTPLILITGYGEREVDVEAMKIGAFDYLVKEGLDSSSLERTIRYAIYRSRMEIQMMSQERLASVGVLAASLAHEIGNPLALIRLRAEYLQMKNTDENVQKTMDTITNAIDRISRLIRALLDLARGEKNVSLPVRVNLVDVLKNVRELLDHEFARKQIAFQNKLPEHGVYVRAEHEKLQQVLINLFVNSVAAIESAMKKSSSNRHHIIIDARDLDRFWKISIQDSGCGIEKEASANLFTPFFTTKESGTGLGLVTSQWMLQSWGGSINLQSKPGEGTCVYLEIPKG